ncbi:transmembrane and death domain protein 1 isoform X3 [Scyliorhinus torazame]|uniref:transmembrane and death domain protein 1 isoform X3 n=1 Tax=Scyliorhinus torazame TaxID=75743 RepID=UPI003B591C4E
MTRIAELLTTVECEELHAKLTQPEKDIMKEFDEMLEGNDNLFKTRKRREITSINDCNNILIDWLKKEGDSMYWDRLSRALRQVGRDDVDKVLEINWDELELIVEMEKLPPYPRELTEGFRTILWGVLFGFVGSTFLGAMSLYFIIKITEEDCTEIMRRSSVLHRIKRRSKPVQRMVYSSDDESSHGAKPSKQFRHYFPSFHATNHSREKPKASMTTN